MKVCVTIKNANIISNVINVTHMDDFLNKNAGINMFGRINNLFRVRKCYELQPIIWTDTNLVVSEFLFR